MLLLRPVLPVPLIRQRARLNAFACWRTSLNNATRLARRLHSIYYTLNTRARVPLRRSLNGKHVSGVFFLCVVRCLFCMFVFVFCVCTALCLISRRRSRTFCFIDFVSLFRKTHTPTLHNNCPDALAWRDGCDLQKPISLQLLSRYRIPARSFRCCCCRNFRETGDDDGDAATAFCMHLILV